MISDGVSLRFARGYASITAVDANIAAPLLILFRFRLNCDISSILGLFDYNVVTVGT